MSLLLRPALLLSGGLTLTFLFGAIAAAGPGQIEINQARALAGGVGPGDTPGFPVTLSVAGTFALTSDLSVPDENTTAIEVTAPGVTLELAGFSIFGVTSCPGGVCSPVGTGAGVLATADDVSVRRGRIRGMGGSGVSLQNASRVEDLDVVENGGTGISVGAGLVRGCTATGNGGFGFELQNGSFLGNTAIANASLGAALGFSTSFAQNAFDSNGGGSLVGGRATGGNACGDGLCSSTGARRFYLTQGDFNGASATTACAAGFHMASLFEIWDVSQLHYDTTLGQTTDDSGGGPPSQTSGWIRTGSSSSVVIAEGQGNCSAWASPSLNDAGTRGYLTSGWDNPNTNWPISPWDSLFAACSTPQPVWCVSD
jgi:hypothetical protein